ncbi:putative ribonuclease H-like domain-containing protein [Tanacetum coccineum]|uniref:Ribonuclease H-like domain-containing protein n=1 Tax=Tanacetum coccineum TaxID=301880 RepID=A0ABQ5GN80_9ASTR
MLVNSKLRAEAVNTACYVLNKVLVIKPLKKTPYELILGRTPLIDFMKPFGCPITILNTKDHLGKFDGKADKGFFVRYSVVSKAMRVFNKRTRIVEETLNIRFLENAPNVIGNGPDWLFDVDSLQRDNIVVGQADKKIEPEQEYILIPLCTTDPLISQAPKASKEDFGMKPTEKDVSGALDKDRNDDQASRSKFERILQQEKQTVHPNSTNSINTVSAAGPSFSNNDPSSPVNAAEASNAFEEHLFERFSPFKNAFTLPPISNVTLMDETGIFGNAYDDEDVGADADLNNLETTINISPIPTTRINKDHPIKQIIGDLHSAPQTRRMSQQNLKEYGLFLSQKEPKKVIQALEDPSWRAIGTKWVFRNKKDERGIVVRNKARLVTQGYTQEEGIDYDEVFAPVARIEAIRLFLAYASFMGFIMYQMDVKSAFLYGTIEDEKEDGIFISQDKYVAKILKKFEFATVKTASTPIETNKALVKDEEAEAVDVHLYRLMIRSLMYLTASRLDIMFAICACARDSPFDLEAFLDSDYAGASLDRKSTIGGCQFLSKRLISWQCKKHTIVANSTTKAEYVAAANCYGQGTDLGSGPRCQDTILGGADAQTRFETTSKQSNDPPISRGYTLRSGEDNMKLLELMELYTKLSDLFWATAKVKTVNVECQLQALVDKKKVIIMKTSIRSDLHLEYTCGTDCLPTATIFEELSRMGAKTTAWNEFSSTMDSAIICLATNQKFNMSKYIFDAMTPITTQPSSSRPQKKQSRRKQRKETEVSLDETQHDDSVPTPSNDPLLSGEDRMQLTELMILCTNLQKQVLDLEKAKDAQEKEITGLKKRVQKLESKNKSRTTRSKRLRKVSESRRVESSKDKDIFDDMIEKDQDVIPKEVSIAAPSTTVVPPPSPSTATTAPSIIPKAKGITFRDAGESITRAPTLVSSSSIKDKGKAKMDEPEVPLKKKDQIAFDEEMTRNLKAQIQAELIEEERLARKKEEEANIYLIES